MLCRGKRLPLLTSGQNRRGLQDSREEGLRGRRKVGEAVKQKCEMKTGQGAGLTRADRGSSLWELNHPPCWIFGCSKKLRCDWSEVLEEL